MPTSEQVTEALRSVIDPELRRDIVELEMVRSIDVHANGVVDVMVSLTTPGCPIRSHFETGVATAVARARRRHRRQRQLRRPLRRREGRPGPQARSRRPARGRAGPGQERHLHRLGQGRRGQVQRHRQPGRGAGRRRQAGRRARRRRVGLLAAAHARRRRPSAPRSTRSASSSRIAAHDGISVMSIGFFVEQDAAVVWRGPMLHKALQQFLEDVDVGRARLPAHRPAARHRRRLDDARPAAAPGQVPDRHHAPAGGPEGGAPLGRDGRPSSSSRSPA